MRGQGTTVDGYSWYFEQFNRNKRSIVLDLYTEQGKAQLTDLLRDADVVNEVVNDPQVLAQRMVIESVRDGRAPIKMTGFPVKLSATPCELRRPAPELGEHSEEILAVPRPPQNR